MLGSLLASSLAGCLLGCLLASSLARLLNFLRSVGHIKPNAAHCFCAVAFKGGVAASAFLNRRFSTGVSAPIAYATYVSLTNNAAAWPERRCLVLDMAATWPRMEFEQITEHGCER